MFAFCYLQWGCRRVERVCVPYICTTFRMSIRKRGVSAGHNVGPLMSRHMSPTGQGKTPCSHACSCVQDNARLHVFCMSRDRSTKTRNEDYHSTVDVDQNRSMAKQSRLRKTCVKDVYPPPSPLFQCWHHTSLDLFCCLSTEHQACPCHLQH